MKNSSLNKDERLQALEDRYKSIIAEKDARILELE